MAFLTFQIIPRWQEQQQQQFFFEQNDVKIAQQFCIRGWQSPIAFMVVAIVSRPRLDRGSSTYQRLINAHLHACIYLSTAVGWSFSAVAGAGNGGEGHFSDFPFKNKEKDAGACRCYS